MPAAPGADWVPTFFTLFALLTVYCPDIKHASIEGDTRKTLGAQAWTRVLEALYDGLHVLGITTIAGFIRQVAVAAHLRICLVTRRWYPEHAHIVPFSDKGCQQLTLFAQVLYELPVAHAAVERFRSARDGVRNVLPLCSELHGLFDKYKAGVLPTTLRDMIVKLEEHIAEGLALDEWEIHGPTLFPGEYDFDFVAFPEQNERHSAAIANNRDKTYLTPPDIFISAEGGMEHILQRGETLPHSWNPSLRSFRGLISPVIAVVDCYRKMFRHHQTHPEEAWGPIFGLVEYFCRLLCVVTGNDFREVFEGRPSQDLPEPEQAVIDAVTAHGKSDAAKRRWPEGLQELQGCHCSQSLKRKQAE